MNRDRRVGIAVCLAIVFVMASIQLLKNFWKSREKGSEHEYALFYDREKIPAPPKNLSELEQVVKPFHDPYHGQFGLALAEDLPSFILILSASSYLEKTDIEGKKVAFTKAFEVLQELKFVEALVPRFCAADCVVRMFKERRSPLAIAPLARHEEFKNALGSRLGVAKLPAIGKHPMHPKVDASLLKDLTPVLEEFYRGNLLPEDAGTKGIAL